MDVIDHNIKKQSFSNPIHDLFREILVFMSLIRVYKVFFVQFTYFIIDIYRGRIWIQFLLMFEYHIFTLNFET